MIIFNDLDDRFYVYEEMAFAQKSILKDTIIPIEGMAVQTGSAADVCTRYLDDYKFATDFNYETDSYNYHIICLGYPALFVQVEKIEDANMSLEYDENENIIFKALRDIQENEQLLYVGEETLGPEELAENNGE